MGCAAAVPPCRQAAAGKKATPRARHRLQTATLAALLLAGTPLTAAAPPDAPQLLWGRETHVSTAADGEPAMRTPLGSLWKLFVYGYLHARGQTEAPYHCEAAQRRSEEEYCCDPGESLSRDEALVRSCGPYFAPRRLGIEPPDWQAFWRGRDAPAWLLSLPALQPATEVEVAQLLRALETLPVSARLAARQALLPNTLRDERVLDALGSGARFKTWSWFRQGRRIGGAAGWLADGTPFWFGAAGTSRRALATHAGWLDRQWRAAGLAGRPPEPAAVATQPCVQVRMFERYPLQSVTGPAGRPAAEGPMQGRHWLQFASGQALVIEALPALRLSRQTDGPRIEARLPLEDYIARVVDREGDARETAAARALAVAARSWLLQNAPLEGGCHQVADSSQAQRVSPQPPSAAARAVAAHTEGLVLQGAEVRYHLDRSAPGVMSWRAAVQAGRTGQPFDAILRQSFPGATLAGFQAAGDCEPLPQATQWLLQRQQRWRARLQTESGFEPLEAAALRVCRLPLGTPHSDQRRLLIRVREWNSREGRVTLLHEYLHLAFRHHPRGQDEAFVERLAQQLVDL